MWGLMRAGIIPTTVTPHVFIIGRHRRHAMAGGDLHRIDGIGIIHRHIGKERVAHGTIGIIVGLMTDMIVGKERSVEWQACIDEAVGLCLLMQIRHVRHGQIFPMQVKDKQGSLVAKGNSCTTCTQGVMR